jgi:hypothetical protein
MNFISEKKAKFNNKIDLIRSQKAEAKVIKLKQLEKENKVLVEQLKVDRQINKAEAERKGLKREAFGNTIAGRVAKNIKSKVAESKKNNQKNYSSTSNTIFSKQASYSNPFSSGSLGSPFSQTETIQKPNKIKSKTIIKY